MKEHSFTQPGRRLLSLLLCVLMLCSVLPMQLWAEEAGAADEPDAQPVVLKTEEGEVPVDENWDDTYPFGTFAFGSYQADVGETGAENADGETLPTQIVIPVHRLGGTVGRVTAKITFAPAITTGPDDSTFVYDYAASGRDDLRIEVENPNPIAACQTLGAPRWLLQMQPGSAAVTADAEEEPQEGDRFTAALSEDVRADSYRWQASYQGEWKDIQDLGEPVGASVELPCTLLWDFETNDWTGTDLRCIYSVNGQAYCAESLLGEVYEPIPAPAELPDGIVSVAEPGYSELEIDEAFGLYEFELTFADGEAVKHIRVSALDDELAELPELALFTITGCEGGELSGACNTLTLMVSDNDRGGASTLGFVDEALRVERSAPSVRIPVRREGDTSYNVTIRYETVDGSAKAGVDYAAASGELSFAGSISEIEIPVSLIANDADEDRSFTVELTALQGGGTDERCTLTTERVTVTITGTAALAEDGSGRNLATLLTGADGEEAADRVTVAEDALLADGEMLWGDAEMQPQEAPAAELVRTSDTRSNHNTGVVYKFPRSSYNNGYWKDWEALIPGGETSGDYADSSQDFQVTQHLNWDSSPKPDSGISSSVTFGKRDNIYTGWLIDSNWETKTTFGKKNSGFQVGGTTFKFGDYFWQFMLDVEWYNVGVYKTIAVFYNCHRYLLPTVQFWMGTDSQSYTFRRLDQENHSDHMSFRAVRAYTKSGGWGDSTHQNANGNASWYNAEPTTDGMEAYSVPFGKDLMFDITTDCCYAWTTTSATSNVGLCDDVDGVSKIDVRRLQARRRYFNTTRNGIGLVLYTANDADEAGNAIPLSDGDGVYGKLAPTVTLVPDKSGVTTSGDLYVGSQLKVTPQPYAGYQVAQDGVFMTNSKGVKVGYVEKGSDGSYYITMMWSGIGSADENETYSINVVYNRIQKVYIDITPSVPRKENSTDIDTSQIGSTWSAFLKVRNNKKNYVGGGDYIVNSNGTLTNGTAFSTKQQYVWLDTNFTYEGDGVYSTSNVTNMQTVNFGMDPEDVILFNGRAYPGNATITLTKSDLTMPELYFYYYSQKYLDAVNPMKLHILGTELYYDGDGYDPETDSGVGAISGDYDQEHNIFTVSGNDACLGSLNGDYPESTFKPNKTVDGKIHQYFLKVYYQITPRSMAVPKGASAGDRAQILPSFTTAITDSAAASDLTEQQQAFSYVAGLNLDDKIMYGAEANLPNYVDIPLGGDVSRVEMHVVEELIRDPNDLDKIVDTKTETTYTWVPNYVGKLLVPYANPIPVFNKKNVTGGTVSMSGENPTETSPGVYNYSAAGRKQMNAFLGSFIGRTTFALGVQQQVKPAAELTSVAKEIDLECNTVGGVRTQPADDSLVNLQSAGSAGSTEGEGPGGAIDLEEFSPGLGTEMPGLEFSLGDNATIIVDGYQVGFAIGLPICKAEESHYSGKESTTTSNGSTTHSYIDDDGNERRVTTAPDKSVTTVLIREDPNDPNKRTITTSKMTPGATANDPPTYDNTILQQTKNSSGRWVDGHKDNTTDDPNLPSGKNVTEKEGPGATFEKYSTLGGFFSALGGSRADLSKFMKKNTFDDDSFQKAKKGATKMKKVEASFSVQLAIMFEFNPIDNTYYFKQAGVTATLSVEFTAQARLPACPAFYVYLKLGAQVEFAASFSCIRRAVEGMEITKFEQGSPADMAAGKNKTLVFRLEKGLRGFHADLDGVVFMSVYDNRELTGDALVTGGLSGDGSQKEVLFQDYGKDIYIKLEARGKTWPTIENLKPVLEAESKFVFDGLNITPSLSLEVGAGVGVELLKFELFLKTSIAITMTLGGYLEDADAYEGFYISSFEWNIAFGFNLTALFFSFSMDVVAFGVEGAQKGTGGYFTWNISATAANGASQLWSKTTYTTAVGGALDEELVNPYGTNIFKDASGFTFYNSDGQKTNTDDNAKDQGWAFEEKVPACSWGGGAYNGEIPLNADVSTALTDGAYVEFSTANKEIELYFDGEITVKYGTTTKRFTESPAKLTLGNGGAALRITATEDTKLDRFCIPRAEPKSRNRYMQATKDGESLVRVSGPTDISATQTVSRAGSATRAFTPTATDAFQLSGYNAAGDALRLVDGLANGYTYQLAEAGGDTYLVYPQQLEGAPQLVLSRLVMAGDLNAPGTGLVHPLDAANTTPYLILDGDGRTDLDFAVRGDGNTLCVTWISYANDAGSAYSVKSRTLDLQAKTAGAVKTLKTANSFRFLPVLSGGDTVWGEASGSGAEENEMLKAWMLATKDGLTAEMLDGVSVDDPSLANTVFYWTTQSRLNELYGANGKLRSASGFSTDVSGQVENIDAVTLDGKTYLLYNTAQAAYFDKAADEPVTVALSDVNGDTERALIRRLYLVTLDKNGFGTPTLLQTVVDFDSCKDSNLAESKLRDGVYAQGALRTAQADPYYANLRFLTADVDGTGVQTLGLFEMGGNSYLIFEADLKAAAGGGSVTLKPVFSETTGTEVTLGSDGTNLAAVYTAPIADSQSNAIFIAWWDRNEQAWGAPTILAMRNLQIYEDRITYDMDGKDAEQAYLGKQTTPGGNTGSADKLTFSNLQMSARTVEKQDGSEGTQLLVLTEGSLTALKEFSFDMGAGKDPYVTMVPDGASRLGFYAIAFGAGEQAIGEGVLTLANHDFSIGTRLRGEVEFTNTGTAAIRASKSEPAVIKLEAGGQAIAEWDFITPIPSGAKTLLSFYGLPFTQSLATGDKLVLTVQEDAYYGSGAFSAAIELLEIAEKPELTFGEFDLSFDKISGSTVYLNLNSSVLNSGSGDANEVFIQFSYDTGEVDSYGREIYRPIDIRGSALNTSKQEAIPTRGTVSENLQQGVYRLNHEGQTNLDHGCYRVVSGLLAVPSACFLNKEELSGLHLRAEIYSDADTPDLVYGVYSSDHDEYNPINNQASATIKHMTVFDVPTQITTALGTTLTLPAGFMTTSSSPDIVLTEVSDGTEDWEPCMGVCYYDAERQVIIAAPNTHAQKLLAGNRVPTGILQIKDQSTNSFAAIAYKVGAPADGVNIYKDDTSFSFYEPDGTATNVNAAAAANPGWLFKDWPTSTGWLCGNAGDIPMNHDLAIANKDGAYLTFETVADTLTIYYTGEITVQSDTFGSATTYPMTYVDPSKPNTSRTRPATINFNNTNGQMHRVRITATKGTMIDRYTATYKSGAVMDGDPNAPQIFWNRSFPDPASLAPGSSVPMTCYILDASGLQSVRFNDVVLTETSSPKLVKADDDLWYFDYVFTANGAYSVRAFDNAGNSAGGSFSAAWFNDVVSASANAGAPGLTRSQLGFVDENGSAIANTTSGSLTSAPYLKSSYSLGSGERSSAYVFRDGAFSSDPLAGLSDERWLAKWNGYYQVRVDRPDGTWARAIVPLTNLALPSQGNLPFEGDGTPQAPYQIRNQGEWLYLGYYVNLYHVDTTGMYFVQTADITLNLDGDSYAQYMTLGTADMPFRGVYDGGGHTLTFNVTTSDALCAPFNTVQNATFRNLRVAGTITTSAKFAAGLCAASKGSVTVENCRSSITIQSSVNGDGTHGGFIALPESGGSVSFTGCVFDGKLLGTSTTSCGGFVGYSRSSLRFRDCLMAASAFEFTSSQDFFRYDNSITRSMQNCFRIGAAPGGQGVAGRAVLAGENVGIDFGSGTDYNVAGLTAYETGLKHNGTFYGGAGDALVLRLSNTMPATNSVVLAYSATAGTLTEQSGDYRFEVPAQDATICVAIALRLEGDGSETDPFRIGTAQDWKVLADYVGAGYATEGLHFLQTDDLHTERMLGTAEYPFAGVYDGGGHTLDVALASEELCCAPFAQIKGATICHLHVTGTVNGAMHCAGLVGKLDGTNNRILDCLVETAVTTSMTHCGGLVGHGLASETTIEGCVFAGSITGGQHVGVLWGWSDSAKVTITNCLELGTSYTGSGVNPVGLGQTAARTVTGTYVTHAQIGSPNRNWPGTGVRAYRVSAGENVALDYGTAAAEYATAALSAYAFGLRCGETLYAAAGADVTVTPSYCGSDPDNAESFFLASAGEFAAENGVYTLHMPAENVTVDIGTHDWQAPTYQWASGNGSVKATRVCKHDASHVETETVNTTAVVTTQPTCTAKGKTTYTAVFTNPVFETQTKTSTNVPALGHDWTETTYTWTEDNLRVTAARHCRRDAAHDESETVDVTAEITTAAGCETAGQTTYTAVFTNPDFETQVKILSNLAATGHDWKTPTYEWAADNSTVTATRVCKNDASHVETETVNVTTEVTTQPTCTAKGKTTYTAAFTNPAFATQTKTLTDVPALGHDWGAPAYEWAADNSTVTATRVCRNDASHVETETVNVTSEITTPATCTADGKTTYTAVFTNTAFAAQTKTLTDVPALGHDYALTVWSWTGYTAADAIFTCKNDPTHVETVEATITSERTEPTTERDGSVVYTATVRFMDETYTDTKTEILPALSHDYVLAGWHWDGFTAAQATFTDRNGGADLTVDALINVVRTEPGCETDGSSVYTATVTLSGNTYTDEKTERLPALGHVWVDPQYEWSEDFETVTATAHCERDASHALAETVRTNFILTQPSTYANEGAGYFLAEFQNEVFAPQTHEIVIPAVGCDGGETCPSGHFTDRPAADSFAHIPIDWAVVNRVTNGMTPTTFVPGGTCTRAQFVTFLWRTMGQPEPTKTDNPFEDVREGSFYYKAVLWAVEMGVTNGTSPTTFSPNNACSRAQVVTFLWRVEDKPEAAQTETPFTDVVETGFYYKAVLWAVEKNITAGTSPTTFDPNGTCTRAQCVTFLYREFAK